MSEENKSPAPTKEGPEERAEKYIAENNEWMFDQNHFHITRSFVNTILQQAYIAGDQSSLQPSSPDPTVLLQALENIKNGKFSAGAMNIAIEALNKYNNKKEEGI